MILNVVRLKSSSSTASMDAAALMLKQLQNEACQACHVDVFSIQSILQERHEHPEVPAGLVLRQKGTVAAVHHRPAPALCAVRHV